MTNKYQEALDTIVEKTDMLNNTCLHLPECLKSGRCHYDDTMCEDYDKAKLLQDLVDKGTAVKPILQNNSDWKCPKCGAYHTKFVQYYCEYCGQKIDWRLNYEEDKDSE